VEAVKRAIRAGLSGLCLLWALPALAQDLVVYPAKGQSAEQQKRDKGECHVWAVEETGFDPASATPPAQTVTTQLQKEKVIGSGAAVRGAAGGAAVGAVTGAIVGDAGKGAAAGAAGGALIGAMRRNREVRNAPTSETQTNPAWTQYQAQRDRYHKAVKACLSGRGYGVE
jgi:uncharacterized protein YcfJ